MIAASPIRGVAALSSLWLLFTAPISAQGVATIAGKILNAETRLPLAGVSVRAVGRDHVAISGADGAYRLQVPSGRNEIRANAIGFAPAHVLVIASSGQTSRQDFLLSPSAVAIDEVVTIGTRALDRTATRSAVPVDVISSAAMQSTGLVETWQSVQRLIPSLNVPRVPLGDDHIRPITLRGFSPGHVLVLVNGKRRHGAAVLQGGPVLSGATAVDINAIPNSAVERIEVLRDGAAAQYGSDAIAGVINIVLKTGDERNARASFGRVHSSEGGREFRDGDIVNVSGTYGALLGRGGHVTISAEVRDREPTNRAYPDARPQYFTGDPRNANPAMISAHEGDGEARDISALANAAVRLNERAEFYAFTGATRRDAKTNAPFFRLPNDDRTVRAIHPDGFLPVTGSEIIDVSGVTGIRGTLRGMRWDLSSAYGRNSIRYDIYNSNNVTLGSASPTEFYGGRLESTQWTTNLDLSRSYDEALPFPINLAFGGEVRYDRYEIEAGEPDAYRDGGVAIMDGPSGGRAGPIGSQGFTAYRPVDEVSAKRSNIAAYLDLDGRVTPRLLVGIAGRAERYSDYGSTSIGKIAGRFEPYRGFAFRGAVATGFRAPSPGQSFFSTTRTILRNVAGVRTPFVIRTLPVNSQEARILGATPLRPETSVNVSGGIIVDVPRIPTLTVDFYAIDVDDRIVPSGEFVDTSVTRLFEQQGMRGIAGGRYFTNAIDTRTRGVDVVTSYGVLIGRQGLLRLTGGFNDNRTRVVRVAAAPPQLSAFQSTLFNRSEQGKIEVGQPRRTVNLTASYTARRIGVNLHNQRFGQASLLDLTNPADDQTVRAKWITDLGVSYQLRPRVSVALNASNLFDVYPDEWLDFKDGVNAQGMSLFGIFRYPGGISPFGMNGRTLYFHLSYR